MADRIIVPADVADLDIIASASGGKDSTALLLALKEAQVPFRAAFADTGWEADETYEYLETLRRLVCPIEVVRPARNMVESIRHRAGFPSRMRRWCTRELKIEHDVMLASPCCQGHSRARGKGRENPQHDASRSTAWAVVSAAEFHRPRFVVVENVPEFMSWSLFPAWSAAMEALGYRLMPHIVDAADHGVPQHRVRLFIVCALGGARVLDGLVLRRRPHVPATSFLRFDAGTWSAVNKPGRAAKTLQVIAEGRRVHGDRFLVAYYGNTDGGRSVHRPIGTITTRDRYAIVDGDRMRMLSADECRAAMGFPSTTKLPANHREAVHMLGNAVPPPVARDVVASIAA